LFKNIKGDIMAKLSPAEANRRRMRIHSIDFEFENLSIKGLRQIVRAALALCERTELCGVPDVKAEALFVSRSGDDSFSYIYKYKHGPVPFKDTYKQSTLDRLARKYGIRI
jgi:hypothetical protein